MTASDWYDTMQVCGKGHIITDSAQSDPGEMKKRCPKCGARTITACPKCDADIQGYYHMLGIATAGPSGPPAYCHECGEAYPWTASQVGSQGRAVDKGTGAAKTNGIFVVHGHDEAARETVARFLQTLGLQPIILHEQASRGQTIIEKLEAHKFVGFAVVLLTPDDVGGKDGGSLQSRARQNVILELGFFCGALGRSRVCALHKGRVELPSDFEGVVYVEFDDRGAWRLPLAKEIKAAGIPLDLNKAM